jgi:hypothetical protein
MEQGPVLPQVWDQLKTNLKSWDNNYWLVFFFIIPLFLLLVFALPQAVRDSYFIFHTSDPMQLQTYILSGYTHSELFLHLAGNLALYLIVMGTIFAFENNQRRFCIMAAVSFFIVPIVSSFLTIGLWHFFGTGTSVQGFSGINAAFLAYAFMAGVTWFLGSALETFDHRQMFPGPMWRYYLSTVLLTILLALIVSLAIMEGQFIPSGNAISNGIAHFGGFVTGLISYAVIDIMTENRKTFDWMLIISIVIGIVFYAGYLIGIIKAVTGL